MQADLAAAIAEVRDCYAEASDVLGYNLWQLVQAGPAEKLDATVVTQPAMLAAGVAGWRAFRSIGGPMPAMMAGHSLGEYTALVCAEAIDFRSGLELVKHRAELMQAAVPAGDGAMAAILGLDDELVIDACARASEGEVVSAVNFNSPGQVVIAGTRTGVDRAIAIATKSGARRAMLLSVSVPSHCALMVPAAEKLAEKLRTVTFNEPVVAVVNNVDVLPYGSPDSIRDGLMRQLHSPVRWADTVRYLISHGAETIIECGPGKVLAGLVRRIDKSVMAKFIDTPESLAKAIAT
jgi:[acyl-carrier-protein] S-malonyltransferase